MFFAQWSALKQRAVAIWHRFQEEVKRWTKPVSQTVVVGAITDLVRSKTDLMLENALLRQQLTVLARQVKRPAFNSTDRRLMVVLASKLDYWRQALLIVQPDTVLRWHRELFKHFWARKSKSKGGNHVLSDEVIALIKRMATENRLWGAERVRGELRKLGWRVGKGTVLKYLHQVRPPRPPSQTWQTFLHNPYGAKNTSTGLVTCTTALKWATSE